jgi:hypothetical protein
MRALALIVVAACSSRAAPPAPSRSIDARAAISVDARVPPDASTLAPQAQEILAEPVPDDVIVRFAEISRTADHSADTRWDLHRDGRLYFATAGNPFRDRPSLRLDTKHVKEIFAALAAQGFYTHAAYESAPGGTTVIVRARTRDERDRTLTTVVYDGSRPDLLDFLETVTVSL